jgi:hypothetical protein
MSLLNFSQNTTPRPFLTVRFRTAAAPAALPEGAWRKKDGFIYVDITDREMLHWFVVTNLAANEAAAEIEQLSMFEPVTRAYQE